MKTNLPTDIKKETEITKSTNHEPCSEKGWICLHRKLFREHIKIEIFRLLIIMMIHVIYNTMEFKMAGASMCLSILFSGFVTLSIFILARIILYFYSRAEFMYPKRWLIIGSPIAMYLLMGCVLAYHYRYTGISDTQNPELFILLNFIYYLVYLFMSFFFLPSWSEFKRAINIHKR